MTRRTAHPGVIRTLTVVLCAALWLWAAAAAAEPVRTLLVGRELDGSRLYAEYLVRLWDARNRPTDERLAVSTVSPARARLRAVERERGHFAVVTAEEAARLLGQYPRLRVVGALWPVYLHALTRNPGVQSLSLPLQVPVWVTENAEYAHRALWELSQDSPQRRYGLEIFPTEWLPDLLDRLETEVLLFSAPAPLAEVTRALNDDPALRLLPVAAGLLEELHIAHPWLQTAPLPARAYPGRRARVVWPARFLVLVAKVTLPGPSVRKMLQTVYGAREAAALFNPQAGQIDPAVNALLAPLLPFHPVSREFLGLGDDEEPTSR